jgi:DNA-binding beta-propeller fold protein YncE
MKAFLRLLALSAAAGTLLAPAGGTRAQLLITGNDEKVSFDETGKTVRHAAGKDTVSIIDIRDPTKPRIVANLPLMNTITGPPVNLAITPDQHLALVANSLDWVKDGEDWKGVPDNKIYVIDLTASPPAQIATVEAGKQASGMAINRAGTLALVANRAEDSVTVLAIDGKNVKPVGTVSVATQPTPAVAAPPPALPVAVAITPDGKRALVVKSGANRVGLLDIDGQKVGYAQVDGKNYDMATGLNPLNVQITPDGKLAIVNNIGGGQDGQVDTVGIIDLEANPPRVIDQVVVGDGPEGLAVSPTGGYARKHALGQWQLRGGTTHARNPTSGDSDRCCGRYRQGDDAGLVGGRHPSRRGRSRSRAVRGPCGDSARTGKGRRTAHHSNGSEQRLRGR